MAKKNDNKNNNNNNGNMETIQFKGFITATSNKIDEEFTTKDPSKACYVRFADGTNIDELVDFGIKVYTSEDDGEFCIIRASRKVQIYDKDHDEPINTLDCRVHNNDGNIIPNFKTDDEIEITFNVVKGYHKKNAFCRIQAMLVDSLDNIVELKPINPFKKD